MEMEYNWPIAHREGWPDLSGGEARLFTRLQEFNAKSRNIKIVFINQFGFEQNLCGKKMPSNMEFMDIRRGSDVEFGMSVYEPFGIAQLEPLTFGGICVISNVCGCAGFMQDVTKGKNIKNVIVTDYTRLENGEYNTIENMLHINRSVREQLEKRESIRAAEQILQRLPKDDSEIEDMIQTGYCLAANMSWDVVVKNYLLGTLQKALNRQHSKNICTST
jgi:hypothetical protein